MSKGMKWGIAGVVVLVAGGIVATVASRSAGPGTPCHRLGELHVCHAAGEIGESDRRAVAD